MVTVAVRPGGWRTCQIEAANWPRRTAGITGIGFSGTGAIIGTRTVLPIIQDGLAKWSIHQPHVPAGCVGIHVGISVKKPCRSFAGMRRMVYAKSENPILVKEAIMYEEVTIFH